MQDDIVRKRRLSFGAEAGPESTQITKDTPTPPVPSRRLVGLFRPHAVRVVVFVFLLPFVVGLLLQVDHLALPLKQHLEKEPQLL